jgi:hypothetical protein
MNDFEEEDFYYDFTTAFYETEIIRTWDSLPDYVKTRGLLNKIKAVYKEDIVNKLHFHGNQEMTA